MKKMPSLASSRCRTCWNFSAVTSPSPFWCRNKNVPKWPTAVGRLWLLGLLVRAVLHYLLFRRKPPPFPLLTPLPPSPPPRTSKNQTANLNLPKHVPNRNFYSKMPPTLLPPLPVQRRRSRTKRLAEKASRAAFATPSTGRMWSKKRTKSLRQQPNFFFPRKRRSAWTPATILQQKQENTFQHKWNGLLHCFVISFQFVHFSFICLQQVFPFVYFGFFRFWFEFGIYPPTASLILSPIIVVYWSSLWAVKC